MSMLKLFFYLVNLIFIILYIFPGSILGKIIYGDFNKQPQLTNDFSFSIFNFSSNHTFAFAFISFFGLYLFSKDNLKKISIYLFSSSIILEFLHIFIPNRSFQFSDLNGNLLGVIVIYLFLFVYFYAKKSIN